MLFSKNAPRAHSLKRKDENAQAEKQNEIKTQTRCCNNRRLQ